MWSSNSFQQARMHASAIYFEQDRKFHNFIIITMVLTSTHDSAIRWEEVLGVLLGGSLAR
jgi:hypothetical protein